MHQWVNDISLWHDGAFKWTGRQETESMWIEDWRQIDEPLLVSTRPLESAMNPAMDRLDVHEHVTELGAALTPLEQFEHYWYIHQARLGETFLRLKQKRDRRSP